MHRNVTISFCINIWGQINQEIYHVDFLTGHHSLPIGPNMGMFTSVISESRKKKQGHTQSRIVKYCNRKHTKFNVIFKFMLTFLGLVSSYPPR